MTASFTMARPATSRWSGRLWCHRAPAGVKSPLTSTFKTLGLRGTGINGIDGSPGLSGAEVPGVGLAADCDGGPPKLDLAKNTRRSDAVAGFDHEVSIDAQRGPA